MVKATEPLDILTVAIEDLVKDVIAEKVDGDPVTSISTMEEFENFVENPPEKVFGVVVCGPGLEEISANELAQTFRMQYETAILYYTTTKREGYERKDFVKNGFDDAFLFPFDKDVFGQKMEDGISKAKKMKIFRPVKLIDIHADSALDFNTSVFLSLNKKHVHFSSAGESMGEEKAKKLKEANMASVYVSLDEMPKFYDYAAQRLVDLGTAGANGMSETERAERLQSSVRDLFTGIFNTKAKEATIGSGKEIMKDADEIVKKYIQASEPSDWFKQLEQNINEQSDAYSHHSSVSTFAALFSMGLQMGKPEDLAVAGLFHDLGLADVPDEISDKSEDEMTDEEKKLYHMHPELSINIIKERKLIVPQNVQTAIMQHHERFDGQGFPAGAYQQKIKPEGLILGFADQFDYLTRKKKGSKRLSPSEAIQYMKHHTMFDPEFLKKVSALIPSDPE